MTAKITTSEIYNLVNQYLRTPANAYILTDEDKATTVEYSKAEGIMDFPNIPLPFASTGSHYYYSTTLKAGQNVSADSLIDQLERWAVLYSRVRYCKFKQQTSGGAAPTVTDYFRYCSFINFPESHLSLPILAIDSTQLKEASGIGINNEVNIQQQVTDALNFILPTLQEFWTDPLKGMEVAFCHSSCHAACHGSRNRR